MDAKEYNGKDWGFCGVEYCKTVRNCLATPTPKDPNYPIDQYYTAKACTNDGKCVYSPTRQFRQKKTFKCKELADCKRVGNQDDYIDATECRPYKHGVHICIYP